MPTASQRQLKRNLAEAAWGDIGSSFACAPKQFARVQSTLLKRPLAPGHADLT